jgi:hypothetical protein
MIEKHADEILERIYRATGVAAQVDNHSFIFANFVRYVEELVAHPRPTVRVRSGIVEPRKSNDTDVAKMRNLRSHSMERILAAADYVVPYARSRPVNDVWRQRRFRLYIQIQLLPRTVPHLQVHFRLRIERVRQVLEAEKILPVGSETVKRQDFGAALKSLRLGVGPRLHLHDKTPVPNQLVIDPKIQSIGMSGRPKNGMGIIQRTHGDGNLCERLVHGI